MKKFPKYRIITTLHNKYMAQAQYAENQAWDQISFTTDDLLYLERVINEYITERDFEPVVVKEFN